MIQIIIYLFVVSTTTFNIFKLKSVETKMQAINKIKIILNL